MENTLFIALSRQATLRREMDVVANNIANVNTVGFKGEKMMFIHHLVRSKGDDRPGGDRLAYVRDIATVRDLSEGAMQRTDNPLDVAVRGDSYFAVQTANGERYTRNGRFRLDDTGQLVTEGGDPVLSAGGAPVVFGPQDTKITIGRDGSIATENGPLGRLRVVRFENEYELRKVAGGLYSSENQPQDVDRPDVVQGMLEGANVEAVIELTRMIEVSRAYESVKSFIDREDERLKKVVREIVGSEQA